MMIMSSGQNYYQAVQARRYERNAAWARDNFGRSIGWTTLVYSPLLLGMVVAVSLTSGWPSALGLVAVYWLMLLGFRVWARKHYRLDLRPAEGEPQPPAVP